LPAITSPERRATIGCCQPKRRRLAATWGMAASLRRGLVGEQKSWEIGTVSTGGVAFFDKWAPQGVGSRLEVRLDGGSTREV
jgi:hypothetical protein